MDLTTDDVPDLVLLATLNEESLVKNLQTRFKKGSVYVSFVTCMQFLIIFLEGKAGIFYSKSKVP